jgi:hypothetical protein
LGGARERDLLTSLHNEFELVDAVGRGFACVMKLFRAAEQRGPPSAPAAVDRSLIGFGLTHGKKDRGRDRDVSIAQDEERAVCACTRTHVHIWKFFP